MSSLAKCSQVSTMMSKQIVIPKYKEIIEIEETINHLARIRGQWKQNRYQGQMHDW